MANYVCIKYFLPTYVYHPMIALVSHTSPAIENKQKIFLSAISSQQGSGIDCKSKYSVRPLTFYSTSAYFVNGNT